jgi:hypothetical protein
MIQRTNPHAGIEKKTTLIDNLEPAGNPSLFYFDQFPKSHKKTLRAWTQRAPAGPEVRV